MGFIGYRTIGEAGGVAVRIYLECREEAEGVRCAGVVDVQFDRDAACRLRGIDGVLVLKKFYKLVFSLEERAREHGNDWRSVMASPERLVEHLRYTRNARDFTGRPEPIQRRDWQEAADPECAA